MWYSRRLEENYMRPLEINFSHRQTSFDLYIAVFVKQRWVWQASESKSFLWQIYIISLNGTRCLRIISSQAPALRLVQIAYVCHHLCKILMNKKKNVPAQAPTAYLKIPISKNDIQQTSGKEKLTNRWPLCVRLFFVT